MANKENLAPALTAPLISGVSLIDKPGLSRQRDNSACRRPETPLKVRKTRENLKEHRIYADIEPRCLHPPHEDVAHRSYSGNDPSVSAMVGSNLPLEQEQIQDVCFVRMSGPSNADLPQPALSPTQSGSTGPGVRRQKSTSRRILSRVKQGIAVRTKGTQSIRPVESETSLVRRISGHRMRSDELEHRVQFREISRDDIDSSAAQTSGLVCGIPRVERSFTNSTVSTADISGNESLNGVAKIEVSYVDAPVVLDLSQARDSSSPLPLSPSPQPTPRPHEKVPMVIANQLSPFLKIPSIDLDVVLDCAAIDSRSKRDIWVAVKATVVTSPASNNELTKTRLTGSSICNFITSSESYMDMGSLASHVCGTITTLRLCFKPIRGCRIRCIIGQKAMKDLALDQECNLFLKLHVPKVPTINDKAEAEVEPDQDTLFTELESIIGTLETELLHVEARYRHSMLPSDNVVTVRHICTIKRPKTESRWSMISLVANDTSSAEAQKRLARYIASKYPPDQALELIQEYLDFDAKQEAEILETCKSLTDVCYQLQPCFDDESRPSVVVTDVGLNISASATSSHDSFSTAPSMPTPTVCPSCPLASPTNATRDRHPSSVSLLAPTILAPPLISAPKTTIALSKLASQSSNTLGSQSETSSGSQDTARQLWRHIRRSSVSAKQWKEMTSEHLEHLEASDETLREIRHKALANKRSVGAETLKGWKWDDSMRGHGRFGEAPWM